MWFPLLHHFPFFYPVIMLSSWSQAHASAPCRYSPSVQLSRTLTRADFRGDSNKNANSAVCEGVYQSAGILRGLRVSPVHMHLRTVPSCPQHSSCVCAFRATTHGLSALFSLVLCHLPPLQSPPTSLRKLTFKVPPPTVPSEVSSMWQKTLKSQLNLTLLGRVFSLSCSPSISQSSLPFFVFFVFVYTLDTPSVVVQLPGPGC